MVDRADGGGSVDFECGDLAGGGDDAADREDA